MVDLSFIFQVQFLDTFKHTRFVNSILNFQGKNYTFITSPIPTVCEDGSTGVFFMIFEEVSTLPPDFENLTNIFSRLFSNWLCRYNECISSRCEIENQRLILNNSTVNLPSRIVDLSTTNNGS